MIIMGKNEREAVSSVRMSDLLILLALGLIAYIAIW